MAFDYIHLPREFTFLLRSNMQSTGYGFSYLKKTLWERPGFNALVAQLCGDLGKRITFEKVTTSLGWLGLRDRIAAAYLHHAEYGVFPSQSNLLPLKEVLDFEDSLKGFSVDGHSRAFLLGFYLKMGIIKELRAENKDTAERNLLSKDLPVVLNIAGSRVTEIDWLCLSLHYFLKNLGKERVLQSLDEEGSFINLKNQLDEQQRYKMTKGLLAYAASIGDKDALYSHRV